MGLKIKQGPKGSLRIFKEGFIRECFWFFRALPRYNITKRPIFLFTNSRSGSTLLMNMIYSQPGVDYSEIPINIYDIHRNRIRVSPLPPMSRYISLDSFDEKQLYNYFKGLINGKFRVNNQVRLFHPDFKLSVNRLVVKEISCLNIIDWITDNFDVDVIYLLRHPVPRALSKLKMGWYNDDYVKAYLDNDFFVKRFLNDDMISLTKDIYKKNDLFQFFVLEWCFENLSALSLCKKRDWLTITYEELLMRPRKMVDLICSNFNLSDPDRMLGRVFNASRSALNSSRDDIENKGSNYLVHRWLNQVEKERLEDIQRILDVFDIDIYNVNSPYPDKKYCNFGNIN